MTAKIVRLSIQCVCVGGGGGGGGRVVELGGGRASQSDLSGPYYFGSTTSQSHLVDGDGQTVQRAVWRHVSQLFVNRSSSNLSMVLNVHRNHKAH